MTDNEDLFPELDFEQQRCNEDERLRLLSEEQFIEELEELLRGVE